MGNRDWNILLKEINTEGTPVKHYMKGQPIKSNTVGWCLNNKHKGAISLNMLKKHKCIDRNCRFFRKNEEHGYWKYKEGLKKDKKNKKRKRTSMVQGTKTLKTGTNIQRNDSNFNRELSSISKYFENSQVYHVYVFENNANSISYIDGFYSLDSAISWVNSNTYNFYVIAYQENDIWNYIGYRKNNAGTTNKIDLTWGSDYPKLLIDVACDLAIKSRYRLWNKDVRQEIVRECLYVLKETISYQQYTGC